MKNIRTFSSEKFQFLVIKFSLYLNRHVFVMYRIYRICTRSLVRERVRLRTKVRVRVREDSASQTTVLHTKILTGSPTFVSSLICSLLPLTTLLTFSCLFVAADALFWSDGHLGKIQRYDLTTGDITLYKQTSVQLMDILIDNSYLYYLNWHNM